MVLIFGVARFIFVTTGVEEFDRTAARWGRRFCRGLLLFLYLWRRFGWSREFPFDQGYVFGDSISIGRADGY